MTETCNREHMLTWIEALESGEFTQARGDLRWIPEPDDTPQPDGAPKQQPRHCCLGVATEIAVTAGVVPLFALRHYGDEQDDQAIHNNEAAHTAACVLNRSRNSSFYHADDEPHDLWCQLETQYLPQEVMEWLGITVADPQLFSRHGVQEASRQNDAGVSFWEIARMLRTKYLKEDPDATDTGRPDQAPVQSA